MASSSTSTRQAFFARFSHQALKSLNSLQRSTSRLLPLILLTGGLCTPELLCSALASNDADLLGIGRGSVLCPSIPSVLRLRLRDLQQWGNVPFQREPVLRSPRILEYPPLFWVWRLVPKIQLMGAGMTMAWYVVAMRRIACSTVSGRIQPPYEVGGLQSVFWMWAWTPSIKNKCSNLKSRTRYYQVLSLLLVITIIVYVFNAFTTYE